MMMTNYLLEIDTLTRVQLDDSARMLVKREKHCQAKLIAHLAVMAARKWHLDLGFPSLFSYCTDRLGLEEGTVYLRLQVAHVVRQFPAVLSLLAEGSLHLSALGKLSPILTKDNAERILAEAVGKSKRQVEDLVVRYQAKKEVGSGITRHGGGVSVRVGTNVADHTEAATKGTQASKEAVTNLSEGNQAMFKPQDKQNHEGHDPGMPTPQEGPPMSPLPHPHGKPTGEVKAANPERYNIRFSASQDFRQKLDRLAEVLGIKDVAGQLEQIFGMALETALDKKDPRRQAARQEARKAKAEIKAQKSIAVETDQQPVDTDTATPEATPKRSRHVPLRQVRTALMRAGYRCEFIGCEGRRCSETTGLEIDHITAFAMGGSHALINLQVLCRAHNLRKADWDFGEAFMTMKARERPASPGRGERRSG